jgi:hypothetical protein
MAQFNGGDPKLYGHWLRTPLYKAVAAILVMLAVSGLLIFFMVSYPTEVISM